MELQWFFHSVVIQCFPQPTALLHAPTLILVTIYGFSLSHPVCSCRLRLWTPPEPAEFPNLHSLGLSPPHTSQQCWCPILCPIPGVTHIQYPVRIKARVRCPRANARPVTPTASKPRLSAYWRGQPLPASSPSFLVWFMGKRANKSCSFFSFWNFLFPDIPVIHSFLSSDPPFRVLPWLPFLHCFVFLGSIHHSLT